MRFVLGFLSGVLSGVAGWFALAALWMALLASAGLEAQALKWVAAAELGRQALLPADLPIIEADLHGMSV